MFGISSHCEIPRKTGLRLVKTMFKEISVFIAVVAVLPCPVQMADFMIGCSVGNFRPSSTCDAICHLLHKKTSCCYGVNYDSRAVCACCDLNSKGKCPTVCNGSCHIITMNAGNCSELRGGKHRSGGGPSIINDLSILSADHHHSADKQKSGQQGRLEQVEEEKSAESGKKKLLSRLSGGALDLY